MSKIIALSSENVKRLSVVEIKPDGNVVVIGGRNGQGKSSVLDSIQYALGGDTTDKMPVRRGEDKAKVVLDLGDIVVRRTFTAAGGTALVVTNADGVRQASPQAILDKLVGKLTFDPLEFARQKPKQQAETLRALVGLDTSTMDAEREKVFEERTAVNREAKALEARMNGMPSHPGAPTTETSTAEILAEQQLASEKNSANALLRIEAETSKNFWDSRKADLKETEDEIERLQGLRKTQMQSVSDARTAYETAEAKTENLKDEDLAPFKEKAATAEQTNRKVRENAVRAAVVKQFKAKSEEAEKLTAKIEDIDAKKKKAIMAAKFPIEGMAFDTAGGVTLNSIPFEQCSSAEQLRVSVAIGIALNPKLRVLLIRDGSLLDEQSLKLLLEMAKAADAQIWLEVVSTGDQTSVIIEDGRVLGKEEEVPRA